MVRTEQELRDSNMSAKNLAPRLADFSVRASEKLRFADTDRQGHITNTVFAVCCQNARMELLCDPKRVPIPRSTQFVIAKLVLEFRGGDALARHGRDRHSCRTHRTILGHARAGAICRGALRRHCRVRRGADGQNDTAIGAAARRDGEGATRDRAVNREVRPSPPYQRWLAAQRRMDDLTFELHSRGRSTANLFIKLG